MEIPEPNNLPDYIKTTSIPGLLVIERRTIEDDRGFFREPVRRDELEKITGQQFDFKQWNHSKSKPGVIRGMHAEKWNKIVYPVNGKVFLALADIRPDSLTFGKVEIFDYDADSQHRLFYVPKGVANSICVVGEEAVNYMYLVDAYWDGSDATAIAYNDPDLNIKWPISNPNISKRDLNNPALRQIFPEKFNGN